MKRNLIILSICIIVCLISWYFVFLKPESTDDAYITGDVVSVYSQVSGYIEKINYEQGDTVENGDTVASIDKNDKLISLKQSEEELKNQIISYLSKNIETEILRTQINSNELNITNSTRALARRNKLLESNAYSKDSYESEKTALDVSKNDLILNKLKLKQSELLIGKGKIENDPNVALSMLKYKDALLSYSRTDICSPISGVIAKRYTQVGAYVSSSQKLFDVIPPQNIWVEANFRENQLKNIKVGNVVKIVSDVYGGDITFSGVVTSIGTGTGSIFSIIPPQNASGNWTKVTQRVPVKISFLMDKTKNFNLPLGTSVNVTLTDEVTKDLDRGSMTHSYLNDNNRDNKGKCYSAIDNIYKDNIDKIITENLK